VKRRKVLQRLGLSLSAGVIMPQLLSSCKKNDVGPEVNYSGIVAIVGAGAAGLYVADILRSKGIRIVVLEAGSELGGRIKTLRNQATIPNQSPSFICNVMPPDLPSIADFPVELGAEITHGSDSIWGMIIQNLNVPTVDLAVATDQFILDQTAKSNSGWSGDTDFNGVQSFISGLPNYSGGALSVQQAASINDRGQALLNSQVGNYYGSSSAGVGARGLAQGLTLVRHDGKWLVLKANPLQDLLLSRFSLVTSMVQLNTQVVSINYSTDPITLIDKSGNTIQADKVIVTVPVSILKGGAISFTPALPGTMTASLANIGMDASVRVVLEFKKNFWGTATGFIWGGATGPQYFNAGVGRSENYKTLSITINGPKAVELSALGPGMISALLAELDAVYAGQATLYIRRDLKTNEILFIIKDWSKEEFILGGYSYPLVNATNDDRKNIGMSINDKLFFAGEATDAKGDAGTINGALASAERVAEEVVISITKL
jgi:monoamine oxidase